jgi:hypothetical protein
MNNRPTSIGLGSIKSNDLTKREHFAGLAMQGLLSADAKYGGKTNNYKMLAEDALCHADALIQELNKKER